MFLQQHRSYSYIFRIIIKHSEPFKKYVIHAEYKLALVSSFPSSASKGSNSREHVVPPAGQGTNAYPRGQEAKGSRCLHGVPLDAAQRPFPSRSILYLWITLTCETTEKGHQSPSSHSRKRTWPGLLRPVYQNQLANIQRHQHGRLDGEKSKVIIFTSQGLLRSVRGSFQL